MRFAGILMVAMLGLGSSAHADRRPYYNAQPFTPAWAAPQLRVYPEVGPPGTRVQISGVKFHRGLRVFYGDQPMPILEVGRRHVVAVIPHGVLGDNFIYVVDDTGRARSYTPFDVVGRYRYRR